PTRRASATRSARPRTTTCAANSPARAAASARWRRSPANSASGARNAGARCSPPPRSRTPSACARSPPSTAYPRACGERPGRAAAVEIRIAALSEGFALPIERLSVVTEEEIFGPRERKRAQTRWPDAAAVESLGHLAVGDHLVHAEHGIGVYRGLVGLELRGV